MQYTHHVPLPLPATAVDLGEWIFNLTDTEYRACATAHQAMGVIGGAKHLGLVNVEIIAGTLIIQHYQTRRAQRDQIAFQSEASRGYILHVLPFGMSVSWEMQVSGTSEDTSSLRCTIGYEAPLWVRFLGWFNRSNHFLHRHMVEETEAFARDIAAKYAPTANPLPKHKLLLSQPLHV